MSWLSRLFSRRSGAPATDVGDEQKSDPEAKRPGTGNWDGTVAAEETLGDEADRSATVLITPDTAAVIRYGDGAKQAAEAARAASHHVVLLLVDGTEPPPDMSTQLWKNRDHAEAFAQVATTAYEELGHLVDTWVTVRDPLTLATHDDDVDLEILHHVLLGHAMAREALHGAGGSAPAEVGIGLHLHASRPADPTNFDDLEAAHRADVLSNHLMIGALLDGGYPATVREVSDQSLGFVMAGDLVRIRGALAPLVVEYRGVRTVSAATGATELYAEQGALGELLAAVDLAYEGVDILVATPGPDSGAGFGEEIAQVRSDGLNVRGSIEW